MTSAAHVKTCVVPTPEWLPMPTNARFYRSGCEMTELVGIPHDVDRLDQVAFDLEGVGLNQAGRPAHNQPGQAVDRVEAHRHVVGPSFADDAGQERRDAIGAFDDIERRRHLAAAVGDEPRVAGQQTSQRGDIAGS